MDLIGKKILGHPFLQDPKPEWIKINGIVLGESKKYSYKTFSSNDIGNLLQNLFKDSKIICVLYNWKNNTAYTKTGFNLNDSNDYAINSDFTTFIRKIPSNQSPSVQPPPIQPPTISNFVKWDNNLDNFMYNGKSFYVVGVNVYWLGYTENNDYPSKNQVIEMFEVAKRMKSTTIRSHTLGISSGNTNSLRPFNNTLNQNAWDAIDFAFHTAKQYDIKLICPLTDAYGWANGGYGDFCKSRGIAKQEFWTNMDVRNDFKDFIYKWLNHNNTYDNILIKNNPVLGMIEIGNELGNIREDQGSINVPTKEWLIDITNYIKSIDSNHLILGPCDECLGSDISDDFNVPNIDVYSGHFYSPDYNRIDNGKNNSNKVRKPYIIGEYSSHFADDWFKELEKRNIKGSIWWDLYCHQDGLNGGDKVDHQDGETLWYPEDKSQLIVISNHFRRLQRLPQVNDL